MESHTAVLLLLILLLMFYFVYTHWREIKRYYKMLEVVRCPCSCGKSVVHCVCPSSCSCKQSDGPCSQ